MRVLVETLDAVGQESVFIADKGGLSVRGAMVGAMEEFKLTFNALEFKSLYRFCTKIESQIDGGLWGAGTHAMTFIDGCTFSISAIHDSKH